MVAELIITMFLSIYSAAQFKAGSKALHVILDWDVNSGAIICTGIVILYCFFGGIRASIWTDAAQSFVMVCSMALLLFFSIESVGSIALLFEKLSQVSDTYLNLFPPLPHGMIGIGLFIFGWFIAGVGLVGQPHIMTRFMTLEKTQNWGIVRAYYYGWYFIFCTLTFLLGLCTRVLIPNKDSFDAELALPMLSIDLLPSVLVGLILAGIFASTMSTADSQILCCTASISRDVFKFKTLFKTKLTTVCVALFALMIALFAPSNVFDLVLIAWSGMASAFVPLLTCYVLKSKVSEWQACVMSGSSLLAIILWRVVGLNTMITDMVPGILTGFLVYYLTRYINANKTNNRIIYK